MKRWANSNELFSKRFGKILYISEVTHGAGAYLRQTSVSLAPLDWEITYRRLAPVDAGTSTRISRPKVRLSVSRSGVV